MQRLRVAILAGVAAAMLPAGARAETIWEVENARGNARAGGPTNAHDRELLDRWGCLSGTDSAYCQRIRYGATTGAYRAWQRQRR